MKTWSQWEADLNRLTPPEQIVLGLERVRRVAERLPVAPGRAQVCTVAGTNGKGSTVEALGALARACGCRYGQYTSPHLFRFTERIRINGQEVSEPDLAAACDQVEAARGDTFLTFFEFTTLAAFVLFASADLDLWILEVGLGGRLDAVNLVDADVSVITQIGLDHQAFLGETLEEIAREKAGILRSGKTAWTIQQPAIETLRDVASQYGAVLETVSWQELEGGGAEVSGFGASVGLPPLAIPIPSAALALAAARQLGVSCEAEATVLETVTLVGRLTERVDRQGVRWWFDVAHNPQAVSYVMSRWKRLIVPGRRLVILGLLADKDAVEVIRAIDPEADLIVVGLAGPRGRTGEALAQLALQEGRTVWRSFDTLRDAMQTLAQTLRGDDAVVVLGSFYMVADALTHDDFL